MLEIKVSKKSADLIRKGYPWVFKNDITNKNSSLELAEKGEKCHILDDKGKKIAIGFFNPLTAISARILTTDAKKKIDENLFREKFESALKRRRKHFNSNFFRAVYGESDGMPGLIVDLYGRYAVAQVNAAGIDALQHLWLPVLMDVFSLKGIYFDSSSKHRIREGLSTPVDIIYGEVPDIIEVKENGLTYFADIFHGQKTGWFYDQRANRKYLSLLAGGRTVIDLFGHSGGFGLLAASNGAKKVTVVDRSELALEMAERAIENNALDDCRLIKDEVFDYARELVEKDKKFDIVNVDPPAFIKSRKDVVVGLKGYEKLFRQCLKLVEEDGIFAVSSCSYFARPEMFQKAVENVLQQSGRDFELLRKSGADKDHPIHPMLDETNYLKFLVYKMD